MGVVGSRSRSDCVSSCSLQIPHGLSGVRLAHPVIGAGDQGHSGIPGSQAERSGALRKYLDSTPSSPIDLGLYLNAFRVLFSPDSCFFLRAHVILLTNHPIILCLLAHPFILFAPVMFPVSFSPSAFSGAQNKFAKFLLTCMKCCFWCLEKCIKFLNRNAYIMVRPQLHG